MRIVIGTNNQGKLKEFNQVFSKIDIQVVSLNELGLNIDVIEDKETFEENSLKKAREICNATGEIAIGDDSGLMVDYLNGAPGVYSKRYFGDNLSDNERNLKLLELLKDVPKDKRTARFVSVISLAFPDGRSIVSRGECEGIILDSPSGDNGFGYDPLFYYPPYDKTFAELTKEEKNMISHRGKALEKLLNQLKEVRK